MRDIAPPSECRLYGGGWSARNECEHGRRRCRNAPGPSNPIACRTRGSFGAEVRPKGDPLGDKMLFSNEHDVSPQRSCKKLLQFCVARSPARVSDMKSPPFAPERAGRQWPATGARGGREGKSPFGEHQTKALRTPPTRSLFVKVEQDSLRFRRASVASSTPHLRTSALHEISAKIHQDLEHGHFRARAGNSRFVSKTLQCSPLSPTVSRDQSS